MAELGAWLREHEVNVLHFIGHGNYDDRLDDGVLYFCDDYGRGGTGLLDPHRRPGRPRRRGSRR